MSDVIPHDIKERVIRSMLPWFICHTDAALLDGLMRITSSAVASEIQRTYGVHVPIEEIETELSKIQAACANQHLPF